MGERVVRPYSILVRPHIYDVVVDLWRRYSVYLYIGRSAYQVLGASGPPNCIVVDGAPTPTSDLNLRLKVLPHDFEDGQEFTIYCVEPTGALARKLAAAEVS